MLEIIGRSLVEIVIVLGATYIVALVLTRHLDK